ncbi:type VII secretion protein EccB [Streptacidiphilus sp. ASG 303]|uniref:type VII secretion protein EccB n=1 Tax=Streptacidiphilus sp. ASG 303 TaxID=2896847 RepID=UPI001E63BD8F|nr:type VII secretion protein EccB [Streptacidiphilus sp. ASG 303]MCD0484108.1 type VII secretion protein EccB [Streptacidiphilus sp. ASG 303]
MQTRRDHVHAYQFAMGRLATALVDGSPGQGGSPNRRSSLGTFLGVAIAVLLCAGFGVYGLVSPGGNTAWRKPGSIIVEKETGTRYLYLGDELRPVRNYASALLIEGPRATVRTVSRNSLAGVRHGSPVGIQGAPDALPQASALLSGPWTRCLRPDLPGGQAVDFDPARGTTPFPADRQVLLSAADGRRQLLWHGRRYPVADDGALIALGLDTQRTVAAPQDWLSALPDGAALAAPSVPEAGRQAGRVAGHPVRVGQLFRTASSGTDHYYVMRADGLEAVSATESALLAARHGAGAPVQADPADIAVAPVSADRAMLDALPDVLGTRPLDSGAAVCLRQESRGRALRSEPVVRTGGAAAGGRPVLVPPGRGVLAVDQSQVGLRGVSPQAYLVAEDGTAYPLDDQAVQTLGYDRSRALPLPKDVLALLPRGPLLTQASAVATVREGGAA